MKVRCVYNTGESLRSYENKTLQKAELGRFGATRYVHPKTGQSVVIDDVTNELLHVGGKGFKY